MNIEHETKAIMRNTREPEKATIRIKKFTNFKEENIREAIKQNFKDVSETYKFLINRKEEK